MAVGGRALAFLPPPCHFFLRTRRTRFWKDYKYVLRLGNSTTGLAGHRTGRTYHPSSKDRTVVGSLPVNLRAFSIELPLSRTESALTFEHYEVGYTYILHTRESATFSLRAYYVTLTTRLLTAGDF